MKICRIGMMCAVLGGGLLSVQAGPLDFFLRKPDIEVITVTDVTPEGRQVAPPTPDAPVYYVAINLGFRDLGGAIGGEKVPPADQALRTITKVLAGQGYLPATAHTPPPSLILVLAWGTLYTDMDYGFNFDSPPIQRNRQQILKFLGGYKMGFSDRDFDPLIPMMPGLNFKSYDSRDFYEMARDDYYMALVSAYDFEAAKQKTKKMLWVTRISCPSRRRWLGEVMPTMLAVAAPHIGRETDQPVWVNASSQFRPTVKIRDLELLEYLDKGDLPVVDGSANRKGKKPAAKTEKKLVN